MTRGIQTAQIRGGDVVRAAEVAWKISGGVERILHEHVNKTRKELLDMIVDVMERIGLTPEQMEAAAGELDKIAAGQAEETTVH